MKMCGLMLKDGATIAELARAMNIHRGTLRDRLIRWGEHEAVASCAHSIDTNRVKRYKKVHYVSCKNAVI
jgi:transposase-like protein